MDTQPTANRCPKCQTPLPPDAPQGLCPKCLFAAVATPTEADQPAGHRPAPPALTEIAAAFPQLEILEFIGQGGMGFVFKARQPKLDRLVALKILPQSLAADPTFAERFNREAKLLARLNHPGIVAVHDFGVAVAAGILPAGEPGVLPGGKGVDISGTLPNSEAIASSSANPGGKMPPSTSGQRPDATKFYYLLMEFVDGVNLRQAMQAGRFTPAQALAVVPKICEALQFAHNEGILHRDIKPENILLDAKGRVKIADFGIAKLMERGSATRSTSVSSDEPIFTKHEFTGQAPAGHRPALQALTEAGKTLGSPNYMAPEQLEHPGEVDHRADIYSLGVVFYEMLTGELPLGRFAPPSQKSAADPRVDEVVLRALEKERERRQHSAGEVKTQVETIAATPPGGSQRVPRQSEATAGEETRTEPSQEGANKRRFTGFQILLRSVVVAFIAGLLVFALAAALTSQLPRTYAATARVERSSQDPNFLQNEFARMESPEFLKQVAAAADLKRRWTSSLSGDETQQTEQIIVRLRNEMELRPVRNTRIIDISFYSEFPGEASDIANAIATVYCSQPGTRIVGIAEVPARPVRPNAMLHLAIGVVGGGFFGLVAGGLTALFLVRRKSYPSSGSRGDEAHSEKSEIGNRKSEIAPRFSRTAIVGAMWLALFFAVVPAFLWHENATREPIRLYYLTWIIIVFAFLLPGFTAPFGSTILGWIAVSQIRRSAGKLHGLWLAVLDGLLFPLLALNFVIARLGALAWSATCSSLGWDYHDLSIAVLTMLVGCACAVFDFFIIRSIWRAVKRPVDTPTPPVQKPDRFWRWFVVTTLAMIIVIFSIAILGLLAAIAIPNFIKARAQSQENARRAAAQTATNQLAAQNPSFAPVMPASALQFRLVVPEGSTEPTDELPSISGPDRFHVQREVLLDGSAVAQAGLDFNSDGTRRVEIQFTAAGKQQFAEITGANINRQLAVVFRGKVLFAPVIRSAITGGQCPIDGNMRREEVRRASRTDTAFSTPS